MNPEANTTPMALGPRLEFRQTQSLVMTPQLLQAIRLLQFSSVELSAYVEAELERNPLLERANDPDAAPIAPEAVLLDPGLPQEGDWASDNMRADRSAIENDLGTDLSNAFPDAAEAPANMPTRGQEGPTLPSLDGGGARLKSGSFDEDGDIFDSIADSGLSMQEHLLGEVVPSLNTVADQLIARILIENIEDTGYLNANLAEIAERLSTDVEDVEAVLAVIQQCQPTGIGARSLAECLALQLKEQDRFDPAMAALVANLDLLAKREFPALRRICGVDEEDLADMVVEIRKLNPKPGLIFAHETVQTAVPDVFVRTAQDGSWTVELNSDAMPRIIANRSYYATVSRTGDKADKAFIDEAWASANWLTRSIEQRARTILKVAIEIVKQQDAFFAYGVEHLRPLTRKAVADAISMHESTISRVTANKFMATPRGLFEMKYFFTTAISATGSADEHSSEAVRHRIRQLIEHEPSNGVLSDDALVDKLKEQGIEIARRTVAKYREAMRIPSSAIRKREKRASVGR
jgi:RNA polymerase sigma-54 factor